MRNFLAETQGAARFRNGFRVAHHTRLNRIPFILPFQFNNAQAYQLEFTHKKLRFYKDEGIILESNKTISAITKANPAVVTSNAHGYANGDEVFLNDVTGMTQVNGKAFIVANKAANTFELTDQDGVNVDSTNYGVFTAGVANRIYEIDTPYDQGLDLKKLKVTQNADTMYIDHPYYEPRKLTRTGHASWTLSLYTRTADPFLSKKNITAITLASPGVLTSVGHGLAVGDIVIIEGIIGTVELNSRVYEVNTVPSVDTLTLKDYVTQVVVDTTAYTAWSSAGYLSKANLLPACPAFYEGRLYHGGMEADPDKFIGSRAPDSTGTPRYEDYTSGTDADHAIYFSIADGEVNRIFWLIGTNRLMFAGTFGTETRISGETSDKAITPTSINVRAENRLGVADIAPINKENIVIYVQRGSLTLRSFEFDALTDSFVSVDRNLVSEHVTKSGITQIAWQTGRPDILWATRSDGKLLGLTFKSREDVSGWHVHDTGAAHGDKFLGVSIMPRPSQFDQVWAATERIIDGHTRRFMEFMEDEAEIPDFFDFYTDDESIDDDREIYIRAILEAQKEYLHLDCALTYDGTELGTDANATMTPSAVTGTAITLTASAAVFKSTDVGREIWKKAINGVGEGRAVITAYTDTTHVTANVLADFDSTTAIAAGKWYMTTASLTNLDHLEGRVVTVVTDGGVHPTRTVTDGAITLDYQSSKVHVGLPYIGHLEPMNIEGGGTSGAAQAKFKNINRVGIRFFNTLGAEVGTDQYDAEQVSFSEMPLQVGSPQLLFSGIKDVHLTDSWDLDKKIYVRQPNPLPCIVQLLEVWCETDNDAG